MLCVRARHRDALWGIGAVWLMRFESSESGELVTDLDHAILIWLKEEPHVAVIYYGRALEYGCFPGGKSKVGVYPGLMYYRHISTYP